jgi:hypothetical protein
MGLLSKAAVKTAVPGTFIEKLEERLKDHFGSNTSIQGIVFEIPPDFAAKEGAEDLDLVMNRIIASLGSALILPSGRVLALLSDTADRELTANQLKKSINAKILAVFSAGEASKVSEYIGPYL